MDVLVAVANFTAASTLLLSKIVNEPAVSQVRSFSMVYSPMPWP